MAGESSLRGGLRVGTDTSVVDICCLGGGGVEIFSNATKAWEPHWEEGLRQMPSRRLMRSGPSEFVTSSGVRCQIQDARRYVELAALG